MVRGKYHCLWCNEAWDKKDSLIVLVFGVSAEILPGEKGMRSVTVLPVLSCYLSVVGKSEI